MLARLQQRITLGLLAFSVAWAVVAATSGHPGWMPVGGLAVVGGYLAFMALEFVLMRCVHGADPAPVPSIAQMVRAWWGEVTTSPRVFCWAQPFRAQRFPDALTGQGRGLVLVHGFVCNRGFWNPWMPQLAAQGVPFVAVSLEPVFGAIPEYVDTVEAAVARLTASTGLAPVIVAHSMGGLVVRSWLAGTDPARAHHVVTIGTPHRGTWAARFGSSPNTLDMRPDSPLQQRLAACETPDVRARFTCFYSHCDNIVFPPSTGTLVGADNRHVPAVAHVHLVNHPAVLAEALRRRAG